MIILPSPLVADARGAHGGLVFKGSKHGLVAQGRPRGLPTPSSTRRKQLVSLARLQKDWHVLTIAERASWNTYASGLKSAASEPNARSYATGWACYAAHNIQRKQFGLALVTTPPPHAAFNAPIAAVLSKGAATYLIWNTTADPLLTGEHILITMSPRTSNATNTPPRHCADRYAYPGPFTGTGAWFFGYSLPTGVSYFFTTRRISAVRMPSIPIVTKIAW